jgi:hypothetical protein
MYLKQYMNISIRKDVTRHLCKLDLLLGVQEVLEEGLLSPGDALVLVGLSVRVTSGLTRLASEDTVQVRTDLVGTASLGSVALSATSLEELGSSSGVSFGHRHF